MTGPHTPVLVGLGEVVDRSRDPAATPEPLDLMVAAARAADADAGGLLHAVNRTSVIHQQSWRYENTAAQFVARCGLGGEAVYGPYGGETPVRFVHEAARRIAAGRSGTELVVSGEAFYARTLAGRQGIALPWTPIAAREENAFDPAGVIDPLMAGAGVLAPAHVYPLFETAFQAHAGQNPAQGLRASAELWARFAAVAATRPAAWRRDAPGAEAIANPAGGNRWIAWPYTKATVANPQVNQAAAVLITSLGEARRRGIAEHRLVYIGPGAWAREPASWLERDTFHRSPAQAASLRAVLAALGPVQPDLFELYSCFPVVPKMAAEALGQALGEQALARPSVAGGLSFFGGPLNSYMLHAVVAMGEALREGRGVAGLLYGQGEFVTKHHALALTREPVPAPAIDAQREADRLRGPVPPVLREAEGRFTAEASTVVFDRAGAPGFGAVVARSEGGRTLARVEDADDIARLLALDKAPIGAAGTVSRAADGRLNWRFA